MEPAVPAAAAGGAGAPVVDAKEPLIGLIWVGPADEGLLETLFKESKGEMPVPPPEFAGKFDKKLGTLSDPSIRYIRTIQSLAPNTIKIEFYTLVFKEVGSVLFHFTEDTSTLFLTSLILLPKERGKGYGKRMLAAVTDIARRTGKHEVSLGSLPSAVSFYLEVDPPFTFNNPSNKDIYNGQYTTLKDKGINNKTAKRTAGNVFSRRIVPMTATLRKSRRANRRKGTRRRASMKTRERRNNPSPL